MKDEPVQNAAIIKFVAGLIAMLAAKYLPTLGLTDEQAFAAATLLFGAAVAVVARVTRGKVTPMAKLEREHPTTFAALSRKP